VILLKSTADWIDRQEDNKLQKLEEERKMERLRKCEKEKENFETRNLNVKIMMALETLPIREKEKFLAEEEKARRLELRAIKENIWKRWRNRREGTVHKSGEEKVFGNRKWRKSLKSWRG
jgi:hypothetical protein